MTDHQKLLCGLMGEHHDRLVGQLTKYEVMAVLHRAGEGPGRSPSSLRPPATRHDRCNVPGGR